MAISTVTTGTRVSGEAVTGPVVLNPSTPANASAGSLLLLATAVKPMGAGQPVPDGWNLVGTNIGGTGEHTLLRVYSLILTEDMASTPVAVTFGDASDSNVCAIAGIVRYGKDAAESWVALVDDEGDDVTHDNEFHISYPLNLGFAPGDVSAIFSAISTSSGTASNIAQAIAGCTLTEVAASASSARFPGFGSWLEWRRESAKIATGASSSGSTYHYDATAGRSGGSMQVRIRVIVPADADTGSLAEGESLTVGGIGDDDTGSLAEGGEGVGLVEGDAGTSAEGESPIVAALSEDQPGALADAGEGVGLVEADTGALGENGEGLAVDLFEGESLSLVDGESQAFVIHADGDTGAADEAIVGLGLFHEDELFLLEAHNQAFEVDEPLSMTEHQFTFLEHFTVEFNGSLTAPGFRIIIRGMLDSPGDFDRIDVIRRDPLGRYPDTLVRNFADVPIWANNVEVIDYEAPLNVPLTYHARLHHTAGGTFEQGPVFPTPDPYIPTLTEAYGGGTAFLTPIAIPELGRAVMIESFPEIQNPAEVLAAHKVLNRRNQVLITDVMGGNEGTFSAHAILHYGQTIDSIKRMFAQGNTVLIRTHNRTMAGFADFYFKVTGPIAYDRKTRMVPHGELDNPLNPHVIMTFSVPFTETDRPDPTGLLILNNTWQDIKDNYATWADVKVAFPTWLDVLKFSVNNPLAPES